MKKKSIAVIIITNGPGELSTWVRPVIDNLKKINGQNILKLKIYKKILGIYLMYFNYQKS